MSGWTCTPAGAFPRRSCRELFSKETAVKDRVLASILVAAMLAVLVGWYMEPELVHWLKIAIEFLGAAGL